MIVDVVFKAIGGVAQVTAALAGTPLAEIIP
jgi:hypothetical protein